MEMNELTSTPRAIARRLRSQAKPALGLYCQVCERQFRDKRAFDAHHAGQEHRKRRFALGGSEAACRAIFSERFISQFLLGLAQLSRSSPFADQRVQALQVYSHVIQDPKHVRLHATRWHSLRHFLKWLLVQQADRVVLVSNGSAESDAGTATFMQPERVWLALVPTTAKAENSRSNLAVGSNASILDTQERRLDVSTNWRLANHSMPDEAVASQAPITSTGKNIQEIERLVHSLTPWNPHALRRKASIETNTPAADELQQLHPSWIPRFQPGDLVRIRNETLIQGQLQGRLGVVLSRAPIMRGCVLDVQVSLQPEEHTVYVLRIDQNDLEFANS
ncbi:hypothetical protein CCYA_CCYA18G4512 [Cyanidiococcus yangmingshanensis]|nr:hypothetical protein CCYA_CCYA18G4512 [Cyanidiococcus yangmingshanensis]